MKRHRRTLFVAGETLALASAVLLCGSPAVSAGGDIVASGSGLTLGPGWYTRETSDGRAFHWADNGAAILIHEPQGPLKKIAIEIQGGPGLANAQDFALHLRDASNHDIAIVHVPGTQTVRFDVPVKPGRDATVKLYVDGGGKRVPKDPRTLNFRVFSIADASSDTTLGAGHPDIASGLIKLDDNWYPLEQYAGETFRWVANDAEFTVADSKDERRRIEITAASGPDVKNPGKWTLTLEDSDGKVVQSTRIKARGKAYFDVSLHDGANTFKLHVDATGIKTRNDARTLSFRVFNVALD